MLKQFSEDLGCSPKGSRALKLAEEAPRDVTAFPSAPGAFLLLFLHLVAKAPLFGSMALLLSINGSSWP